MAVTQNEYTGNGSTTTYSFTFPYLQTTDVKVKLDGVTQATTAYTFPTATTVQMNSAPDNNVKVLIYRDTGNDNKKATFYPGSAIKAEDLNDDFDQILYTAQEIDNYAMTTLGDDTMIGNLQMGENQLVFEGATADAHETSIGVVDPTADRTINFPNVSGTVITTGDTGTVTSTILAANSVDSSELVDGSIDTSHIADLQVTTAKIAADAVTGAKIADDSIDSEHYIDGSIDHQHLASGSVTSVKLQGDVITADKIADDAVQDEHINANAVTTQAIFPEAVTTAKIADNAVTTAKINADAITGAKIADDQINSEHYVDGSIDTAHIADDQITTAKIVDDAVTTAKLADAELTTLAGMPTATASALADSTALDVSTTEINRVVKNKYVETSITNSDNAYPTSGAVIDYVAAQIAPLGGLEVIATEVAFPNTQPASGVVISISDAGGVVFNGSGVSTTGRTVGGSTVTINGAPSSLYSETLVAGVGLMVSSTGSSQTYNYHKILGKEDDIKQLSDDINDFNARYRIASSAPSSNNDDGDLYFDTSSKKMKVYNASTSQWDDVASSSSSYIVTLSESFNGTLQDFTMSTAATDAQSTIVSINGVIQKPNAGTSTPSEGFAISGNTLKLAAAPPTGSDYFVVVLGDTVSIGTPSDNTVSTAKIQNGAVTTGKIADDAVTADKLASNAVVNASVDASAAIAGTKVAPDFGSQNIVTTGTVGIGTGSGTTASAGFNELTIEGGNEDIGMCFISPAANERTHTIAFGDSNNNNAGKIQYNHSTDDLTLTASDNIILTGDAVGIGTTSPGYKLHVAEGTTDVVASFTSSDANAWIQLRDDHTNDTAVMIGANDDSMMLRAGSNTRVTIAHNGLVGIGVEDPSWDLDVHGSNATLNVEGTGWAQLRLTGGTTENYITSDDNLSFYVGGNERVFINTDGAVGIGTDDPRGSSTYQGLELSGTIGGVITFSDDEVEKWNLYGAAGEFGIYDRVNTRYNLKCLDDGDVQLFSGNLVLPSGKGIMFHPHDETTSTPGSDSNLLNDYEEGTFTPSISSTSRSGTITYSQQVGFYTKIGNRVFAQVYMQISGGTNTVNAFLVDGLPFANISTTSWEGGGYHTYMGGLFSAEADRQNMPWVGIGLNYVKFHKISDGSQLISTSTSTSSNYLIFHVQYVAA